jgi:hypothetical protein
MATDGVGRVAYRRWLRDRRGLSGHDGHEAGDSSGRGEDNDWGQVYASHPGKSVGSAR